MSLFVECYVDQPATRKGLRDVILSMRYEDLVAFADFINARRPVQGPISGAVIVAAARDLVPSKPAEAKKP